MANYYLFRVERQWNDPEAYDAICKEIKCGYLRQGWGWKGTRLNNKDGETEPIPYEQWIANVPEDTREWFSRKYRNLSIMLNIKAGDTIIIPKVPSWNQFTICKAAGTYQFKPLKNYDGDDFHHAIPIDVDSIREADYYSSEDAKNIHAKLRGYQSPINNVYNDVVINAVSRLIESPEREHMKISLIDMVGDIRDDILKNHFNRFRDLGPKATENIVKSLFERMGFEYISGNSYDRQGGDADLIFADNIATELGDFSDNSISKNIYVQVKNKSGNDDKDIEGIYQLIRITQDEPGASKILISTADSFSEECKRMADKESVLLISANGFLRLVMKYL